MKQRWLTSMSEVAATRRWAAPVAYTVGGARQKLSLIATVTNQGKACWMIMTTPLTLLREAANDHMAMLEKNPKCVMSCFQDVRVKYAA